MATVVMMAMPPVPVPRPVAITIVAKPADVRSVAPAIPSTPVAVPIGPQMNLLDLAGGGFRRRGKGTGPKRGGDGRRAKAARQQEAADGCR